MKPKRNIIKAAWNILAGFDFSKIGDENAVRTLYKDYNIIRRAAKEASSEEEEIVKKHQQMWAEELADVNKQRAEVEKNLRTRVEGHDEYLKAEKVANKAIADIYDVEVDINPSPIKLDHFIGISMPLEHLAILQECGILEE